MKHKIKVIPLLTALAMLLSLCACGTKEDVGNALTPESTAADLDGKVLASFGTPIPEEEFESLMNERIGGYEKAHTMRFYLV